MEKSRFEFPELFDWGNVDSLSLSALGELIADQIRFALRQPANERHFVPGLREALRLIAKQANIIL